MRFVPGATDMQYAKLGDEAAKNLVKKLKAWYQHQDLDTMPRNVQIHDVVAKLVSVGYLKLNDTKEPGNERKSELVLNVDRSRFVILLNRVMMLDRADQQLLIELLNLEVKKLREREDANQAANATGIYSKFFLIIYKVCYHAFYIIIHFPLLFYFL